MPGTTSRELSTTLGPGREEQAWRTDASQEGMQTRWPSTATCGESASVLALSGLKRS